MTRGRAALARQLRSRGGTTVFLYAPGFSGDDGLDAAHITELTGIGVEMLPGDTRLFILYSA